VAGIPVSLAELVRTATRVERDDVFVARAGKVTAYDELTNTAVVKPMVKHALFKSSGERVFDELPEIPFVPVMFPRAGNFVLTMPVPVGTPVTLLFLDVSHAEWVETGDVSEPVDAQRHGLGWPVAILGMFPDNDRMSADPVDVAARTGGMVIGEHDGTARIEIVKADGPTPHVIKIGKDATDFVALASKVMTELAAIRTWANAHTHGGAAATPTLSPATSVAAEKTKAK